ncbi:hypothetical protein Ancab_015159 [Ancistrocladus abbreviatus]
MAFLSKSQAFGCSLLFLSLLFSSLSTFSFAITDAEASIIIHRQLLHLNENDDLPDDYESKVDVKKTFPNPRLKKAYIALQSLKKAVYSDPDKTMGNWEGPNMCDYKGVFCVEALDDPKLTVVADLDINHADIAGYLPVELGLLTGLALFHINSNRFCGIIPKSFSKLKLLFELDLSNNRFVGSFPKVLLSLKKLKFLDLRFEGAIPETLGNSTVSVVVFSNNEFTGCILSSIGKMVGTLNEINFQKNDLGGCIPLEMGNHKNDHGGLIANPCGYSSIGKAPVKLQSATFSSIGSVVELDISHNKLTGSVPGELCKLPGLKSLTFSYNYFKGESQVCDPEFRKDATMEDKGNCLPNRPEQRSPKECFAAMANEVDCSKDRHCGGGGKGGHPKPEDDPHDQSPADQTKAPPPPEDNPSEQSPAEASRPPPAPVHSPPPPLRSPPSPVQYPPPPVHSPPPLVQSPPFPVYSPPPPIHSPPPQPPPVYSSPPPPPPVYSPPPPSPSPTAPPPVYSPPPPPPSPSPPPPAEDVILPPNLGFHYLSPPPPMIPGY